MAGANSPQSASHSVPQHGRKAGLHAFSDHQHVTRLGKADGTATTRAEHHLLWIDGRFAAAILGEKSAMNSDGRSVDALRHQRHHRRPDCARRVLEAGMPRPTLRDDCAASLLRGARRRIYAVNQNSGKEDYLFLRLDQQIPKTQIFAPASPASRPFLPSGGNPQSLPRPVCSMNLSKASLRGGSHGPIRIQ